MNIRYPIYEGVYRILTNVFRHAELSCSIYGIAHIGMMPHSHHAPPVAGKQYPLQDNVSMYALMHCAKSSGYF